MLRTDLHELGSSTPEVRCDIPIPNRLTQLAFPPGIQIRDPVSAQSVSFLSCVFNGEPRQVVSVVSVVSGCGNRFLLVWRSGLGTTRRI